MFKGIKRIKGITLSITLTLLCISNVYAEKLATQLRGKIIASNLSNVEILIKESDGSILDMTSVAANGTYKLDISVMDEPSLSHVKKLIMEVKNKAGNKKTYYIEEYITDFNETVVLNPIVF